ncbi:MAG: hypothetical protein ACLGHO_08515, partial [Gammaproteobacteria bacterium]
MVYTKRTPWTLIMGIIMVAYAWAVKAGMLEGVLKSLNTTKLTPEMITLGFIIGGIAIVVGLWQLAAKPSE